MPPLGRGGEGGITAFRVHELFRKWPPMGFASTYRSAREDRSPERQGDGMMRRGRLGGCGEGTEGRREGEREDIMYERSSNFAATARGPTFQLTNNDC